MGRVSQPYRQLSLQGPAPGRHGVQLVPQVLRLLRHVLKQHVLLLNLLPPLLQLGLQGRYNLKHTI